MNLLSLFSSTRRVAQRVRQSTLLLALTAVTSAQAALPTVEGPKSSTDSSFYGQISGYVNDGIVLGGLGHHSCVAVKLAGADGSVNLLLTITGTLRWPTAQDYAQAPRWYINLPDAVDAVYLVTQLEERLRVSEPKVNSS
ncbi:hypothetical protein [Serratia fonticola]|uniref:hypothetical protein n=1 Tax=Serratia fonticola TaxID=47917 RepID=UPI003BB4C962